MSKKTGNSGSSSMFRMPSGFTHNAPSLAGETYTILPALAELNTPTKPQSKGGESGNIGQLRHIAQAGGKGKK